jgi:uncharacterized protein
MIVDCHTHVWESVEQLGRGISLRNSRARGEGPPRATTDVHRAATRPVDRAFVLAFRSHYLDAEVPNDYVGAYVRQNADRLIGFASVDPTRPAEAIIELRRAREKLGMLGLTVWPAAQDFHPASTSAMRLYPEAVRLGMPVMFHIDVATSPHSKMEYARPMLVDEVAREFPELRIVIAQLGYPWTEETIVLLGKHDNVFADISGLMSRPWHAYNSLLSAYQAGVMDRLLFGSNFPYASPAACIESLYSIHQFCHGTNLPAIPREQLRQIVERNALELLGIESPVPTPAPEPDTSAIVDE